MRLDIAACATTFIGNIIVPSTISAIVVIPQNKCVLRQSAITWIFYIADSMEFFADLSFYNLILFWL
jgi:hypothetical protein